VIVVSDFDGTLTIEDVTTYVWDKHLRYDWRAELLPPTYAGTWTPLQMIARGYADIPVPPEALLADVRAAVQLRPGLEALAAFCRVRGWPLVVASHGLSFYIEALLPTALPVAAFAGTFTGSGYDVSLPAGFTLAPGEDFKSRVVADLVARHPGHPTVYLGDGRLDLAAAERCDRVFAVRDSRLAQLLREAGREVTEFDDLEEVTAALG
jgi:2-hydroxy-3-keto-5-methylthiopentenyl-1-phosphate phosphatase